MIIDIELKNAKFVYSKDDFCYQEVIEDFNNATKIGIITYNISKKSDDYLLESLYDASEECDIQIITNIPQRYELYYSDRIKSNARGLIKTYLMKLDPKKFKSKSKMAFNFNNHMKVIATNNIAYFGSANFSLESSKNFEVGTITKDVEFIQFLFTELFCDIYNDSILYYPDAYNELRLAVSRLRNTAKSHLEYLELQFYKFHEEIDIFYYDFSDSMYNEDDYNDLVFIVEEWGEIENLIENIDYEEHDIELEMDNILEIYQSCNNTKLNEVVDYKSSLYEFSTLSYQNLFDNIFEDYSSEAFDEYLEGYIAKASDEANDIYNDAGNACEDEVKEIRTSLTSMLDTLESMILAIDRISEEVVSKQVDNTQAY